MTALDAQAVSDLSGQLGYPLSEETIHSRIVSVLGQPQHAAYVAEIEGCVVGWIHVYIAHLIEASHSYAEIGGLVVNEASRGKGVGKALVRAAEEWTISEGFDDIRVRSASRRIEAHQFYEKLGYRLVKTQMRFEKNLLVEK